MGVGFGVSGVGGERRCSGKRKRFRGRQMRRETKAGDKCDIMVYRPVVSRAGLRETPHPTPKSFGCVCVEGSAVVAVAAAAIADAIMAASSAKSLQGLIQIN